MDRRDLSKFLLGSVAGTALISQRAQAQSCVAPCYAQTAAEAAASVTPTDTSYPPGDVRRYGAIGDGVNDDTTAIQAAIDVVQSGGASVVYLPACPPTASYRTTAPLVATHSVVITGDGQNATQIIADGLSGTDYILDLDCAAANVVEHTLISNLTLRGDGVPSALRIKNTSLATFKNLRFYNVLNGAVIEGTRCFGLAFEQVEGYSIAHTNFRFASGFSGGGGFTFNTCTLAGQNGVLVPTTAGLDNLSFIGCNFEQHSVVGIFVGGLVRGVSIVGCRTEGGDGYDFNFRPFGVAEYVDGISISGCVFNAGDSGSVPRIILGGDSGKVRGFSITGNTVAHSAESYSTNFVQLNGDGESGVIAGNVVHGTTATGAKAVNVFRPGVNVFGNENLSGKLGEFRCTFAGSATYDPPSLADGNGVTTTVTATGASVGDLSQAAFSNDLQGITLTSWVSAANTVSVRFQNESGGLLNLSSGTLRVQVTKV